MAEGDGRSEAGDTEQVLWRIMGGGVFFGVGNEGGISAGKVTARKKGVGLATQPFKGLHLLLDRYLNPNDPGVGGRRGAGLEVVDGGVEAVSRRGGGGGGGKGSGFEEAEGGSRITSAAIHRQGTELLIFLPEKERCIHIMWSSQHGL